MNFGAYGILIIFGAFILLIILNPKLSCFGKWIKSPLYPLLRKRSQASRKQLPIEDYGFDLEGDEGIRASRPKPYAALEKKIPTEDYGFNLRDSGAREAPEDPPGKGHKGKTG
ncbi:MAG: hypothetical protein WBB73_08030 [Candidatus Aminicenantaceae bacterium]